MSIGLCNLCNVMSVISEGSALSWSSQCVSCGQSLSSHATLSWIGGPMLTDMDSHPQTNRRSHSLYNPVWGMGKGGGETGGLEPPTSRTFVSRLLPLFGVARGKIPKHEIVTLWFFVYSPYAPPHHSSLPSFLSVSIWAHRLYWWHNAVTSVTLQRRMLCYLYCD